MSLWFQQYRCDVIADGLVIGAVPRDADDVGVLVGLGVSRVVSLVADVEYEDGEREAAATAYAEAGIVATGVPSEDFGNLSPAVLEAASGAVAEALSGGETVYLHCRAGWQRSVVSGAAALSRATGEPPERTLQLVMERRRGACPLPHQIDDLMGWWAGR